MPMHAFIHTETHAHTYTYFFKKLSDCSDLQLIFLYIVVMPGIEQWDDDAVAFLTPTKKTSVSSSTSPLSGVKTVTISAKGASKSAKAVLAEFEKASVRWGPLLPAVPKILADQIVPGNLDPSVRAMLGISWLGSMMNESGHAGIGCVVCNWALKHGTSLSSYKASDSRKFATYQITALKKSNLLRHEKNPCHIANVSAIFEVKCGPGLTDLSKVPTEEQFMKVWNAISKGTAPSADIAGVGSGSRKVPQICWCLAEGLWEMDRAFIAKGLQSLGICRDESKHRIDVRFSATVKAKGKIVTRRGFMGRAAALHGSAATDILDATQRIFKSFATSSEEPPRLPIKTMQTRSCTSTKTSTTNSATSCITWLWTRRPTSSSQGRCCRRVGFWTPKTRLART